MAKQLINVGSQANDGTGDNIRSGAQKINSSINEIYNDLGDGTNLQINISTVTSGHVLRSNGTDYVGAQLDYGDLSGRPIIPASQVQVDWNAESGVQHILNKPVLFSGNYNNLTNKPTLSTVATSGSYADLTNKPNLFSGSYADLTNKPNLSTVSTSGSYADLTNKPNLFSGSYADLSNKPNLSTVSTSGSYADLSNKPNLSTVATSGSYADLTNKPETLLDTRGTVSVTTGSISNNESENLSITGFKAYALLKIQTNRAARVVVYTDSASRTADASRGSATDPDPGSGVITDITTTGSQTFLVTPATIGFNADTVVSDYIYLKVTNLSGSSASVEVILTLLQLEN
jgi:hypothetical protein